MKASIAPTFPTLSLPAPALCVALAGCAALVDGEIEIPVTAAVLTGLGPVLLSLVLLMPELVESASLIPPLLVTRMCVLLEIC